VAGKIRKTEAEWKSALTEEQYRVTRLKGTELAFTGEYWKVPLWSGPKSSAMSATLTSGTSFRTVPLQPDFATA